MKESIRIPLKGQVTIIIDNLSNTFDNTIDEGFKLILLRCMTNFPIVNFISKMKVTGDFGEVIRTINSSIINTNDNSIIFNCLFDENSFNGNLTKIEMFDNNDLRLSVKDNLNIFKSDLNRMEVRWKIKIE
jgi:hypothetical protein